MRQKQARGKLGRSRAARVTEPAPIDEFVHEVIESHHAKPRTRSIGGRANREGRAATPRKALSTRTRSASKRSSSRPAARKAARTKGTTHRRAAVKKAGRKRARAS